MPIRLVIGLLVCTQFVSSANAPLPAEGKEALIKGLNAARKEVASKYQIANMNEMTYESSWESVLEKLSCSELDKKGSNYVVVALPDENTVKMMEAQLQGISEEQLMENVGQIPIASFLVAGQNKVACAGLNPPCSETGPNNQVASAVAACLVGPRTSFSKADFVKGEPATECINGKSVNGLCETKVSVSEAKVSVPSPPSTSSITEKDAPGSNISSFFSSYVIAVPPLVCALILLANQL